MVRFSYFYLQYLLQFMIMYCIGSEFNVTENRLLIYVYIVYVCRTGEDEELWVDLSTLSRSRRAAIETEP